MSRWLMLVLLLCGAACARPSPPWELVWSDEFDYAGLPDSTRWDYEQGFVRNEELQFYTRARLENARVEEGRLVIEGRQEAWPNPAFSPEADSADWQRAWPEARYTSAALHTAGKAEWTYGRIEVMARLPHGRGTWPAIWTLGGSLARGEAGWPECGEIDIMEYVGFQPDTVHGTIHTGKFNHVMRTHKGSVLALPTAEEEFHLYAIEWDSTKIDFFVDSTQYFTFENDGSGADAWPFDQPQYLILNLAIGGGWGAAQGMDESIFPQRMEVDYVRVYRKNQAE